MGIALGGRHGLFTNPAKSIGHIFSLKQLVPDIATAAGAALGSVVPGVGTAIGAGLGQYAGDEIEGETGKRALMSGLETGAETYAGGQLGLGGGGGGAGAGGGTGTLLGNAVNTAGNYVGLGGTGGTLIGNAINTAGADVGIGGAGTGTGTVLGNLVNRGGSAVGLGGQGGTVLGNAINTAGADVGIGATPTTTAGATSAPTLGGGTELGNLVNKAGSTVGVGGPSGTLIGNAINKAGTAVGLGGTAPATTDTFQPGYGAGNLPLLPAAPAAASTAAAGAGGSLLSHPLMTALAASPAILEAIRGSQPYKGETQLQQSAAQLGQEGTQLQNYLQTGTLPPGAQAAINQATNSAQAAIRSQYAAMGMTGSSAEAQDLAAAQQAGVTQATNMAMQLLSTGMNATNMSDQMYQDIMNQSMAQDQGLSSAIGIFAHMAAGGTGGTNAGTSQAA